MDSMLNKAMEAADKYSSHGNSRDKDESTLHHMKHKTQKIIIKHVANDYAEDHGFSRKKHHDNQDESILGKAKDAMNKYTGHESSQKKGNQDESMLDKAKEMMDKVTGHGDIHKKGNQDESVLDKAKEMMDKVTRH